MPLCAHCGRKPACRPRGLCWGCYYNPEVRGKTPSVVPRCILCQLSLAWNPEQRSGPMCAACEGGRGMSEAMRAKLLEVHALLETGTVDAIATDAGPGSVRKVAVLCVREALGLPLWDPGDATGYEPASVEW